MFIAHLTYASHCGDSVLDTVVSRNRFAVGTYSGVGGTGSNQIIIIINVKSYPY